MLRRITFAPRARLDLIEIGRYIAQDNPSRAASFIREIKSFAQTLVEFPNRYPLSPDLGRDVHVAPYGKYSIFFQPIAMQTSRLLILRVLHSARDTDRIFNA